MTENELFLDFRDNGNEESFTELFKKSKPWLFKLTYRITGIKEAAEDIIHDTWLKIIEEMDNFNQNRGKITNLLFTVAKNMALQFKYRKSRYVEIENKEGSASENPDIKYEMLEMGQIIRELIKKLKNKKHQDAILLFYFAGLNISDVAKRMDTNEQNIKNWLKRGRDKLEKEIKNFKEFDSVYETILKAINQIILTLGI